MEQVVRSGLRRSRPQVARNALVTGVEAEAEGEEEADPVPRVVLQDRAVPAVPVSLALPTQ